MLILQSCSIIHYHCSFFSALNTNFTDLIGACTPHPASCLENVFRQISSTGGRFSSNIFFQSVSCSYVQCVSCSSFQQSKGTQCTALDQIVRYIIRTLISPFLQKSERYSNVVLLPLATRLYVFVFCYCCWQLDIAIKPIVLL